MFDATNIVKNSNKEKSACISACGIAFDGKGSWNFGNDFAENVVIFNVDNSSSSHDNNRKNNFLVVGKGPALVHQRKSLALILVQQTKFCLSLHYNGDNSYLFGNRK